MLVDDLMVLDRSATLDIPDWPPSLLAMDCTPINTGQERRTAFMILFSVLKMGDPLRPTFSWGVSSHSRSDLGSASLSQKAFDGSVDRSEMVAYVNEVRFSFSPALLGTRPDV